MSTNLIYGIRLSAWVEGLEVDADSVTLQGDDGGGFDPIPADEYRIHSVLGAIAMRQKDSDSPANEVDWDAFTGTNKVKVATYTLYNPTSGTLGGIAAGGTLDVTNELHTLDYLTLGVATNDDEAPVATTPPVGMKITASEFNHTIKSDNFVAGVSGWRIKRSGVAEFEQVTVRGTVYASAGVIGGFTLASTTLTATNLVLDSGNQEIRLGSGNDIIVLDAADATYRLWIGNASPGSANVSVTKAGVLTAANAVISGTITATGGTISGNLLVTGTLQSSATANLGYKLSSTGFRTWNSSNVQTSAILADGSGFLGTAAVPAISWTTAGALTVGGFSVGTDYIRDAADSFGFASTVSGSDDVRIWVGANFASRASASFQVYESGLVFAKDIILAKGTLSGASGATGYGYAVGDPLLLLHFDGAKPFESDYYGSLIGHKGQAGTYTWNAVQGRGAFRYGKFNKGVQIAEATTNLVLNPSAETTSNFTGRGSVSISRSTSDSFFGSTSYRMAQVATQDGIDLTLSACANAIHYVSVWVARDMLGTLQASLDGSNWNTMAVIGYGAPNTFPNGTYPRWTRFGVQISAAQANGSTTLRLRNSSASGVWHADGIQVEQKSYPTPYCDGTMGDGHAWDTPASPHASKSSRTASILTYPASGNINLAQGTFICWYHLHEGGNAGFPALLDARIDSNNRITVHAAQSSGTYIAYVDTLSGGSTVSTASGAVTQSAGWHMAVVTWQTGGSLKMYIDGVQSGASGSYVVPSGTLSTIEIGSRIGGGAALNDIIDEFAILPVVLPLNEIKSIYYSEAPLMVGVTNQEFRLSGAGLGEVFGNANGLFARDADGNAAFALLNGSVDALAWGGDTETLGAGDFMFGSNKSNKPNLFYDASDGELEFRVAKTRFLFINASGLNFVGGSGAVNTIKFLDGANEVLELQGFLNGTTTEANLVASGKNSSNRESILNLTATTDDGAPHAGVGSVSIRLDTELDGGRIFMNNVTQFLDQIFLSGNLNVGDGHNLVFSTSGTGTKIAGQNNQLMGFWGATPIARPSGFTQTYATTTKTHSNLTSATLTDSTGGTANTTLESVSNPPTQAQVRNNFADLAAQVNALRVDLVNVKGVLNAVIDDHQLMGLLG